MYETKVRIDMKELTAYNREGGTFGRGRMYFFRHWLRDGTVLAFYSDSPWGRVHDMEKGWAVIDLKKRAIVDEIQSRVMGESTGETRMWMKQVKRRHGRIKEPVRNEWGEIAWKMSE